MHLFEFSYDLIAPIRMGLQSRLHYFAIFNGSSEQKSVRTDGSCGTPCGGLTLYNTETKPFNITATIANYISGCLETCDVLLAYTTDINVQASIEWSSNHSLTIKSQNSITIGHGAVVYNNGAGIFKLMSGMENLNGIGAINFQDGSTVCAPNGGKVEIYYNPTQGHHEHKYHNPYDYSEYTIPEGCVTSYMLINTLQDLGHIALFPSGNYALSQDIHATATINNFTPIFYTSKQQSFYGDFDGNGYSITGLSIIDGNNTGLFRNIVGAEEDHTKIRNLIIADSYIEGNWRVGTLAGNIAYADIENIYIKNVTINASSSVGYLSGSMAYSNVNSYSTDDVHITNATSVCIGGIVGAVKGSVFDGSSDLSTLAGCIYDI